MCVEVTKKLEEMILVKWYTLPIKNARPVGRKR